MSWAKAWAIDRSIGQPLATAMISSSDSIRGPASRVAFRRPTVITVAAGISRPVADSSQWPIAAWASPRLDFGRLTDVLRWQIPEGIDQDRWWFTSHRP